MNLDVLQKDNEDLDLEKYNQTLLSLRNYYKKKF